MSDIPGKIQSLAIGNEKRPLVIIDDFLADCAALRAEAQAAPFQPFVRFFPGVQAPFPFERMNEYLAPHSACICDAFGFDALPALIECGFALVTTPPDRLSPLQRIPHIDTTDDGRLAILAYISGQRFGGTAFYRHRSTGFEYVDRSRNDSYNRALDIDVEKFGVPPPAYITGDTDIYEKIAEVNAAPGRALIYRSNSLHSGCIKNAKGLAHDVNCGRLTLNAFMSAKRTKGTCAPAIASV